MECRSLKFCYLTNAAALRAARLRMGKHRRVILHVYRCMDCKQWHMTSRPNETDFATLKYQRQRKEVPW